MATTTRARPGRQQDILRVFTELVAVHGYDETSVSEIARTLQLSKGTIMHHFGSKDRLLRAMALGYMERRLAELEEVVATISEPVEQLRAVIGSLLRAHRDDRASTLAFAREFMRFAGDPVMEDVRALRERYTSLVREIFEAGIASGVFRPLDSTIATLQVIGMIQWIWTWYEPSGRLSSDDIAATFVDVTMHGVLS